MINLYRLTSLVRGKYHFIDNNIAIEEIKRIIKYGDTILIKGSRGMKLDEIFSALTDDNMEG